MAVNLVEPGHIEAVPGVRLFSAASAMRYTGRDDLLLMQLAEGSKSAAVFTTNRFRAAPVLVAQYNLSTHSPRALLVNAGNANAGTGDIGIQNCEQSCQQLAKLLACDEHEVLPFSTGVIGEQLDMQSFGSGVNKLLEPASECDWLQAAKAIMTTDTVAKAASRRVEIDGEVITVSGIAKGSGMICPNMATMLSFVATDAKVSQTVLNELLARANDMSFHRITVDSDTSTNDAVVLTATGQAQTLEITDISDSRFQSLYEAVEAVLTELAHAIVRDGEGATKFVKVDVKGGASQNDCAAIAYSVAHSPLVKTALNASDPNWGRLLMAIGKAQVEELDIDQLDLEINGVQLLTQGQPDAHYAEAAGQAEFDKAEIVISVDLNLGEHRFHVWTTDLSHGYVSINADYRS